MTKAIVWFRNDMRLNDHPALVAACEGADEVYPVFIVDERLVNGSRASANRNRFLRQCLIELQTALAQRGSGLLIRVGRPEVVLPELASQIGAQVVLALSDLTPFARSRDERVTTALRTVGKAMKWLPGRIVIDTPAELLSGSGRPYQVFTPFYKSWLLQPRRPVLDEPVIPKLPLTWSKAAIASLSKLELLSSPIAGSTLAVQALAGGRHAAQERLDQFMAMNATRYQELHDDLAADGTSHLSADLHFGSLSAREVEVATEVFDAFRRQLAWRDFYQYVLWHFPDTIKIEFQERYRGMAWVDDESLAHAWRQGQTGYPVVDAAMRQLLHEGYMHNRARLIVGSFLTKDLGLDWRIGEDHFTRHLIDGDTANNNGNWQWIASVGVDPAPMFRRLYNPMTQQTRYDPTGAYVRRYVPELAAVPLEYLARPWEMPLAVQKTAQCVIGRDYPEPIVDHAEARQAAIERYRIS